MKSFIRESFPAFLGIIGVVIGAVLTNYASVNSQREALAFQRVEADKERFVQHVVTQMHCFERWQFFTVSMAEPDTAMGYTVHPEDLLSWTKELLNNTYTLVLLSDSTFGRQTIELKDAMVSSIEDAHKLGHDERTKAAKSVGHLFGTWLGNARLKIQAMNRIDG